MGGAPEAEARVGAQARETNLISGQACAGAKAGEKRQPQSASRAKTRTNAKVEELPQEAREAIEAMLAGGTCSYQDMVEALDGAGFTITKSAIGRHDAGKTAEERQERLFTKQLDGLSRYMKKHSGFDVAGATLALVIGRLSQRIEDDGALFGNLSGDKAVAGLIQAVRAATQYEKNAGDRKKLRADARAEAIQELREALKREPDLWEQIEALVAKEQ